MSTCPGGRVGGGASATAGGGAGSGGGAATLARAGGGDTTLAGAVGGNSTSAGTGGGGTTSAGTGGGDATSVRTGGGDATSVGTVGGKATLAGTVGGDSTSAGAVDGDRTGTGVHGDRNGMVADFPRSIGDQRWRVWTCCREDPSGTAKEVVARTLNVCWSRALSTGAGALWYPVAVRTGAYGTNTVAAAIGVEGTTSIIAAWTSGGAKSSRESTSSTKAEVAAAMPCMKAVSSKEQAISRSKVALGG